MKKILNYVILSLLVIALSPLTVLANSVNVGVEIKGIPVIDAITTISNNIIIDIESNINHPAYLKVQNRRDRPVDVYITDIEALNDDSPKNFLDFNGEEASKLWYFAGKDATESNIAFGIRKGEYDYVSIMPSTEVKIGTLARNDKYSGVEGGINYNYEGNDYLLYADKDEADGYDIYPVHVRTGQAWETSKLLNYNITMVIGLSEEGYKLLNKSDIVGHLRIFSGTDNINSFLAINHEKLEENESIEYFNNTNVAEMPVKLNIIETKEEPDGSVTDYIKISPNEKNYSLIVKIKDSNTNTNETIFDVVDVIPMVN